MLLHAGSYTFEFPRRPVLVGIVNLGLDSFSGDGHLHVETALEHARMLVAEGAEMIDVGVVSARPDGPLPTEAEEVARFGEFQQRWYAGEGAAVPLAVNTWRPGVVRAVLAQGAEVLNDLSGLPDEENARACAEAGAALLIMHTVGAPKVAHRHVQYADLWGALREFFAERLARAEAAGVPRERIILDPGLDFAKQRAENVAILRDLGPLREFGRPVLLPISRKSYVGEITGVASAAERDAGTVACVVQAWQQGVELLRVHNVRAARQAIETLEAVRRGAL